MASIFLYFVFLFNHDQSIKSYLLCFSIFPNVAHVFGHGWSGSPQIWSIGVEEQFYLIWPLIFSLIFYKNKSIISFILLGLFLFLTFLPHGIAYLNSNYFDSEFLRLLEKLFNFSNYNGIAIGCFIGIAYWKKYNWVGYLNSNLLILPLSITILSMWLLNFKYSYYTNEIFAILFSLMILGLVGNKTINIDNKIFKFLGKISYGIYMYHWMVIEIVIHFLVRGGNLLLYNIALYSIVIGITILISFISYAFFEKKFIGFKKYYQP
jgi:peptidoglycan/LPS O-acetylase OafA/YrhL